MPATLLRHRGCRVVSAGRDDPLAILVHFGDVSPTIALASSIIHFTQLVTVAANDGTPRPPGLDPRIRWLRSDVNRGYAGGVLYAVAASAPSEYAVILNTDLEMSRTTWERCLRDLDENPRLGIVGPVLRHRDGALQSGCGETRGVLRWNHVDRDPGDKLTSCEWVTGAAMFLRRSELEACEWDTSYFLGFEDLDLCRRFARAGLTVACEGRTAAIHDSGTVIGSLWTYYYIRNRLWFARRHERTWHLPLIVVNAIYIACRSVLGDVRHRRSFELSTLFFHGVLDGLRPGVRAPGRVLVQEPRGEAIRQRSRESAP